MFRRTAGSFMAALLFAGPLTGCAGPGSGAARPPGPGSPARPSANGSAPATPTAVPEQGWKRNRACAGTKKAFTPEAVAYRRDGPNRFNQQWFDGSYGTASPGSFTGSDDDALVGRMGLPDGWEPGIEDDFRHTEASLVLCHTATPTGTRRIATCEFVMLWSPGPAKAPVVPATHHFEVYESKTGRLVTSFDLKDTERRPEASCPDKVRGLRETDVIGRLPSSDALLDKLRPLRDGTAPG